MDTIVSDLYATDAARAAHDRAAAKARRAARLAARRKGHGTDARRARRAVSNARRYA